MPDRSLYESLLRRMALAFAILMIAANSLSMGQRSREPVQRDREYRRREPIQGEREYRRWDSQDLVRGCRPKRTKPCQPTNGTANCLGCEQEAMASAKRIYEYSLYLLDEEQKQVQQHYQSDMQSWRGRNPDIRRSIEKRYAEHMQDIAEARIDARRSYECMKEYVNTGCCGNIKGQYWTERCEQYREGRDGPPARDENPGQPGREPPQHQPPRVPPANTNTPPAPEIVYRPECDRSLLFVNNPEQVKSEDLADVSLGHKTIFQETVNRPSRIFFEHTNRTGFPIGYGVLLYNPNRTAVQVTVDGSGFVSNVRGGEPFRQLFAQKRPVVKTVGAGKSIWLIQSRPSQILNRAFFSGVVDFESRGGPVVVSALGYRSVNELDGRSVYQGYIERKDYDPVSKTTTDESRVYKGTMDCAGVVAEGVDFTVDDSSKSGPLEVRFTPRQGGVRKARQWHTHTVTNPDAIKGDMFDITMPGGKVIRAEGLDPGNRANNLGNWGVVYTLKGEVTNNGRLDRCVSINLKLTSPREQAVIAWRDRSGIWHEASLPVSGSVRYYTFPVRAGQQRVPYEASFVLGGPSSTNLLHSVLLLDGTAQCR